MLKRKSFYHGHSPIYFMYRTMIHEQKRSISCYSGTGRERWPLQKPRKHGISQKLEPHDPASSTEIDGYAKL